MPRRRLEQAAAKSSGSQPKLPRPEEGDDVGGWKIGKPIGSGSFGAVFLTDRDTKAIKLEVPTTRSQLLYEARIYQTLKDMPGIPTMHDTGTSAQYNFLVMDRVGKDLQTLMQQHGGRLSRRAALVVGCQGIQRLHDLHHRGILHRDLKPQNFSISNGTLYVLDFGLAKAFRTASGDHIPVRSGKRLTGTPRFVSSNIHEGIEQSRRDDLISLVYLVVYLIQGSLPWQGLKGLKRKRKDRHSAVAEVKKKIPPRELCGGLPGLTKVLETLLEMGFDDEPPYQYLVALLRSDMQD